MIKINKIIWFLMCLVIGLNTYSQKKYTVVLDAGHGGKDPGALRGRYFEKKIALSVALKVGKLLADNSDLKIIYTRNNDRFIELYKRAEIANNAHADLFVSIHCNAVYKTTPKGTETFVLGLSGNKENIEIAKRENSVILMEDDYKSNYDFDPNSPESVIGLSVLQEENLEASLIFAGMTQENFVKINRKNRGVKQANLAVLRKTVMPSVLIELGFISNKSEGAFLYSDSGQNVMAKAVYSSIITYFDQLTKNTIKSKEITKSKKKSEKLPKTDKKLVDVKKNIPKVKTNTKNTYEYAVQLAATKNYKKDFINRFKSLEDVKVKEFNTYHIYLYGTSTNYKNVKELMYSVRKKGFKDAFIVKLKNGERI